MKLRDGTYTKLRKNIKYLREQNKHLKDKVAHLEKDRDAFRRVFINNLRCSIEVLGKGTTWNMQYVVKTLSEQMTQFERWYWGCF